MNSVSLPLSRFRSSTLSFSLLEEELMLSTVSCKLQVLLSTPCNVFFNVPSCAFRLFEDLMMSSRRLPTPLILSLYKVIVAIGTLLFEHSSVSEAVFYNLKSESTYVELSRKAKDFLYFSILA